MSREQPAAHTEPPDDLGHYMQAVSELHDENERLREALRRIAATREPTDQRLSLAWLTWHDLREIARVALGGRL